MTLTIAARLEAKTIPEPMSGCRLWIGANRPSGYGRVVCGNKTLTAHRVAWETFVGPIPPGMDVLHSCDNPPCVNPDHLFLGTDLDNVRDMIAKGRDGSFGRFNRDKTHCKQGHVFDLANTRLEPQHGRFRRRCRVCLAVKKKNEKRNRKDYDRQRYILKRGKALGVQGKP